ncbi:Uncharacterized protein TCM_044576 [Theobroma cacao]|uniref:Uncharacterized protein n=1 Tax=Theobroma cacao TaxID=3641 RepID=A0A061FQ53_THECC|nr:Uncharacterized protein TCM_044576 [Theobroma cacao]
MSRFVPHKIYNISDVVEIFVYFLYDNFIHNLICLQLIILIINSHGNYQLCTTYFRYCIQLIIKDNTAQMSLVAFGWPVENWGIKTGFANYKIFDSADLKDQEWNTTIVATTSKSSTPSPLTLGSSAFKATTEKPEEQLSPTPIKMEMS